MFDITTDIQPLTHFKRHTPEVVKQLKNSGRPMVLTIDGKAELVVMDAAAYQEWQRQEMIAFLDETDEDIRAGRIMDFREALEKIGEEYGLPHRRRPKGS